MERDREWKWTRTKSNHRRIEMKESRQDEEAGDRPGEPDSAIPEETATSATEALPLFVEPTIDDCEGETDGGPRACCWMPRGKLLVLNLVLSEGQNSSREDENSMGFEVGSRKKIRLPEVNRFASGGSAVLWTSGK